METEHMNVCERIRKLPGKVASRLEVMRIPLMRTAAENDNKSNLALCVQWKILWKSIRNSGLLIQARPHSTATTTQSMAMISLANAIFRISTLRSAVWIPYNEWMQMAHCRNAAHLIQETKTNLMKINCEFIRQTTFQVFSKCHCHCWGSWQPLFPAAFIRFQFKTNLKK